MSSSSPAVERRRSVTFGKLLSRLSGKSEPPPSTVTTASASPPSPSIPPLNMPPVSMRDGEESTDGERSSDTGSPSSGSGRRAQRKKLDRRGSWTGVLAPGKSPKSAATAGSPNNRSTSPGPLKLSLDPANPVASMRNDESVARKIEGRLRRGCSALDGQGNVYIYRRVSEDGHPVYRKVTCKECALEQQDLTLVAKLRCKRRRHAHVLISLLADRARVRRYYTKEGGDSDGINNGPMISMNRRTDIWIHDVWLARVGSDGRVGRASDDWYMADEHALIRIVATVVQDVNAHWEGEPWEAAE